MRPKSSRVSIVLAAAFAPLFLNHSRAFADVYMWAGPFSGTIAAGTPNTNGNASPWNNPASWVGGAVPPSSPATQLVFPNFDSNSYTTYNNIGPGPSAGSPTVFSLNSVTVNNWSTNTVGVDNFNNGAGVYQMQLTGASPTIVNNGAGASSVGQFSPGTTAGTICLILAPSSGTTTVTGSGTSNMTLANGAGIAGTGGLTIAQTGIGALILAGTNTFTGGVNLNSGTLQINGSTSLGSNTLTINGGSLRSLSGTIPDSVILNSDLLMVGGPLTVSGAISGNGGVHVIATSSQTLTLSASNNYSGATTLDPGVIGTPSVLPSLILGGSASIRGTSAINLGQSSSLTFTASSSASSALSTTAPITDNGANLVALGNAAATLQSFGTLTVSGDSIFTYNSTSGSATGNVNTLAFGNLSRSDVGMPNDNATLFFRGLWTGATVTSPATTAAASFAAPLSNTGSGNAAILPYAAGSSTNTGTAPTAFVSYAAGGITLIPITSASVTQLAGGAAASPVTLSTNAGNANLTGTSSINNNYNVSGTTTVNALATSALENLTGTGTLTVTSGAVLINGGALTLNGPTLDFGSATGYLHLGTAGGNSALSLQNQAGSSITGSGGVVFSAETSSSVSFGSATGTANSFTGGLTLNGPVLFNFKNPNQLGDSSGAISLNGGILNFTISAGTTSATVSQNIVLGSAGGGVSTTTSGTLALAGNITGPGNLTFPTGVSNLGTVVLSGTNSYLGSTIISGGTLNISSGSNLGAGPVALSSGGTLQFGGNATLSQSINWGGGFIDTNGSAVTVKGPVYTNPGAGIASVSKNGAGTLTLTADSPNLGAQVFINAGTLSLAGAAGLHQAANFNVASGATLTLDNTTAYNPDRIADLAKVQLVSGNISYLGNAATPSTETIGNINLIGSAGTNATINVQPANATLIPRSIGSTPVYNLGSSTVVPLIPAGAALIKTGTGTLLLNSVNTYPFGSTVNGGSIRIGDVGGLGFGAVVTTTLGATTVNPTGALDLGGKSLTEPITLSGGSLINSSPTPAVLTSGVKGNSLTLSNDASGYKFTSNTVGQVPASGGIDFAPGDSIAISGGGGTGAAASPVFGLGSDAIVVDSGGSYSSGVPTVTVSGGGGYGATAIAVLDSSQTVVDHIQITNPGSGYTSIPTITVSNAANVFGTLPTVHITSDPFSLVGLQQTAAGSGYTSAPTYSITSSSGTGAIFNTAAISSIALTADSSIGGVGDIVIAPGISGNFALTKVGTGTVTLNGAGSYTGGTNVSAGVLAVANNLALGSNDVSLSGGTLKLFAPETITNNLNAATGNSTISIAVTAASTAAAVGNLSVSGGATLSVNSTGPLTSPRAVLKTSNLNIATSSPGVYIGTLDVQSNDLDLPGADVSSISLAVRSGFANGAWTGTGITSSAAAADSRHLTTLGVISNSPNGAQLYGVGGTQGTFDKTNPGAGDVLVKYTYYGDANLSGAVDGSDYSLIDNGFLRQLTGWYNGDFNYDNTINGSDYTLIDNAFNNQSSQLVASSTGIIASPTALVSPVSAVPEPAGMGLLGIGALGALRRRRAR